jgi:hypothetical protein
MIYSTKNLSFGKLRKAFFLFAFAFSSLSYAGYAGGPYVVWVNLDRSIDGKRVDKIIANFATRKSVNCDGQWKMGDSLLYMVARPSSISDSLIEDVFLRNDKIQMKRLSLALKNHRDADFPSHEGLDGIIIYSNKRDAKIMSFTKGRRKVESLRIASQGELPPKKDIEDAFCALLPPITRAP